MKSDSNDGLIMLPSLPTPTGEHLRLLTIAEQVSDELHADPGNHGILLGRALGRGWWSPTSDIDLLAFGTRPASTVTDVIDGCRVRVETLTVDDIRRCGDDSSDHLQLLGDLATGRWLAGPTPEVAREVARVSTTPTPAATVDVLLQAARRRVQLGRKVFRRDAPLAADLVTRDATALLVTAAIATTPVRVTKPKWMTRAVEPHRELLSLFLESFAAQEPTGEAETLTQCASIATATTMLSAAPFRSRDSHIRRPAWLARDAAHDAAGLAMAGDLLSASLVSRLALQIAAGAHARCAGRRTKPPTPGLALEQVVRDDESTGALGTLLGAAGPTQITERLNRVEEFARTLSAQAAGRRKER